MKNNSLKFKILLFILVLSFILPNFQGLASPAEDPQVLRAELRKLEEQIVQYEAGITKTEGEKRTLRNQIYLLRNRIGKLDAQIRQNRIAVGGLEHQVKDTKSFIEETYLNIENSREKLAVILRAIHQQDQTPMIEVFLTEARLSDFFDNLIALEVLHLRNQEVLGQVKKLKSHLEEQKQSLEEEKGDVEKLVTIQILQKEEGAKMRREQERFLKMTEVEHRRYQREKAEVMERAAEIRAKIVRLIDIPEGELLSFGELHNLAKWVEGQTGIRPAFLLSIIIQESALGRNVGGCYLVNFKTAEGVCIRIGGVCTYIGRRMPRTMNIGRDIPHFLTITREVGRDPERTPVSCWIPMCVRHHRIVSRGIRIDREGGITCPSGYFPFGFGGAMGPAQFIPSTWMTVRDRVRDITNEFPDPWNTQHAFLASATYLNRLGGNDNELHAAMRYFSGNHWTPWEEQFYGRPVIRRANCIQTFFDHGTMTPSCRDKIAAFIRM